jgi:hypothetical protein
MVGIHEPLCLYKYISSKFGKKRRKKQSDFKPAAGYLFLSLNSAEDRMYVMCERKTCLELITCAVDNKTIISFMAFLSRFAHRLKTQNLDSMLFYLSFLSFSFSLFVYGNFDSVFHKFGSFIAAASSLRQCYSLKKV